MEKYELRQKVFNLIRMLLEEFEVDVEAWDSISNEIKYAYEHEKKNTTLKSKKEEKSKWI